MYPIEVRVTLEVRDMLALWFVLDAIDNTPVSP